MEVSQIRYQTNPLAIVVRFTGEYTWIDIEKLKERENVRYAKRQERKAVARRKHSSVAFKIDYTPTSPMDVWSQMEKWMSKILKFSHINYVLGVLVMNLVQPLNEFTIYLFHQLLCDTDLHFYFVLSQFFKRTKHTY